MGDGDARRRRHGDRTGDARDDADRHPGLDAGLQFLPAATEDERVPALQPDHRLTQPSPA